KAGVYGAIANIIAIPLTTFLIMPLEALALLLDSVGLGAPIWWLCGIMLNGLLNLAHFVSTRPGAITMLPTMPLGAYGLIILGGIWLCLWKEKWRFFGLVPVLLGSVWMLQTRPPDLYITGDGRHVGVRSEDGELAMLRTRSGDFIRNMVLENAGIDGEAQALENWPEARCNKDSCSFTIDVSNRKWNILATRSGHYIPAIALSAACRRSDIVISERWLPKSCQPRWLKVDRNLLMQTGGMTINLSQNKIVTVRDRSGNHQWMRFRSPEEHRVRKSRIATEKSDSKNGE
ncbi:DNA internalization-related competence protein ComEC/Rec2, partial [hydrothermal vent metagenome]